MVGTIQSTRKPAVQPGLFQSMASCMNRTFVVQMKAFQRKQTPVHNKNKSGNRSFIEPAAGRAKLRKLLPFPFQNQNRPTRKAFTKALASSPV